MARRRIFLSDIAIHLVFAPLICCWVVVASCVCPRRLHSRRYIQSQEKRRFLRRQVLVPRPGVGRRDGPGGGRRLSFGNDEEDKEEEKNEDTMELKMVEEGKGKTVGERDGGDGGKKTFNQLQSPLFKLPLELRTLIYRTAIGDGTIHVVLKKNRLGHVRCPKANTLDCPLGYNGWSLSRECCWGKVDEDGLWVPNKSEAKAGKNARGRDGRGMFGFKGWVKGKGKECDIWNSSVGGGSEDRGVLALLRCCRMIYTEAIPQLYKTNTFALSDIDLLRHLSSTTLPQRFSLIRSLDISWVLCWPIYDSIAQTLMLSHPVLYPPHDEATWEDTWRIIAGMKDLRKIRVSLLYFGGWRDGGCEEKLLAPLWAVGGSEGGEECSGIKEKGKAKSKLESFEVHVSWRRSGDRNGQEAGEGDAFVKGAPFTLIRPVDESWAVDADYFI